MVSRTHVLVSFIIVILVFVGVGSFLFITNQYEPPRVAVIMMEPGQGDRALADQTYAGLDLLTGDIVVDITTYEINNTANANVAAQDIIGIVDSANWEIVCAVGARLTDATHIAATERPNQKFALIGGESSDNNVMGSIFDVKEAAFLAGFTAALVASPINIADMESNNTGYIALMGSRSDDLTVQEMFNGFIQGAKYANDTYLAIPSRQVHIINQDNPYFLGAYNDSEDAYTQALDWYLNEDVSLIFAPVRASIVGIRQAMFEANETLGNPNLMPNNETRRPLAIGAEGNQDFFGNPDYRILSGPSWITTSVVLRTDYAIYDIVNQTLWGEYEGGVNLAYNYYNGGCNITTFEFSSTYIYPIYDQWISDTVTRLNWNNGTIIIT